MAWIVVMDRVGGYLDYLALLQDSRAYDQIIVALNGESDASEIRRQQQRAK